MGWVVNATPRPLYSQKRPGTHCSGYQAHPGPPSVPPTVVGGTEGRSGRVRKISPSPAFDPRTVQLLASRYTDWAILVYINGHFFCIFTLLIFLISLIPFVELSPCLHIPSKRSLKHVFTLQMAHKATQFCHLHVSTCIYVFIRLQYQNDIVYIPA
jgi:hypothetical protein